MKWLLPVVVFLILAGNCWATDLSFVMNDDSAQALVSSAFNRNEFGESLASFRVLYDEDKDVLLGTIGAGVLGEPGGVEGMLVGAQVNANLGREDDLDLANLSLGLLASYQPPQVQGVGVYGRTQYAPKLLSFIDSERMWEVTLGVNYTFTPKAGFLLEYQKTKVEFENFGKHSIDEALRVGFRFNF